MNFIIVGFDKTGKTNIAKKLAKILKCFYFKPSHEHSYFAANDFENAVKYTTPVIIDFVKQIVKNKGIVLDRGIPCHYAYSKTFNRDFDEKMLFEFDKQFFELDFKIIFCHKISYNNYDDTLIDEKHADKINCYYLSYLRKTKMEHLVLDTTNENLAEQIRKILEFIIPQEYPVSLRRGTSTRRIK